MAESKVPLDTVIKQLSDTLQQHSSTIRELESSVESIQSQIDIRLTTLRTENQDEICSLETNFTSLIESKDAPWTQLSDNMLSLNNGLRELKLLMTTQPTTPSPLAEPTPDHNSTSLTTLQHNSPSCTIVLPPATSIPTFSGKSIENPRQFLLCIEQYTCTVNNWSRNTLLRGTSQFLKDDALEWYCQLYHTNTLPNNWSDFSTRFLTQFYSPIRIAEQEQIWIECKEYDDENINQFVVRLRSLWLEQKPDEHESDFIKHLFCKMRPDILNLMNLPRSTQLFEKLKTSKKSFFFAIKHNVNVSSKNPISLPILTILAHDLSSLHLLRNSATPIFLHSLKQPVARMLCHNHFYLHTQLFRKIPVIQLLVGAVTKLVIIQQSVP